MMSIWPYLLRGVVFFFTMIYWAVILDVLLSWFTLLGVHVIIGPLNSITRPLYELVRKIFPTRVGVIDLAPMILVFILIILQGAISPFL